MMEINLHPDKYKAEDNQTFNKIMLVGLTVSLIISVGLHQILQTLIKRDEGKTEALQQKLLEPLEEKQTKPLFNAESLQSIEAETKSILVMLQRLVSMKADGISLQQIQYNKHRWRVVYLSKTSISAMNFIEHLQKSSLPFALNLQSWRDLNGKKQFTLVSQLVDEQDGNL